MISGSDPNLHFQDQTHKHQENCFMRCIYRVIVAVETESRFNSIFHFPRRSRGLLVPASSSHRPAITAWVPVPHEIFQPVLDLDLG